MKKWVLEGGTTVEIGGKVEGEGVTASWIRGYVKRVASGERIESGFGIEPSTALLDFGIDYLVDSWLRSMFKVVSGPEVEYPELPQSKVDPRLVY